MLDANKAAADFLELVTGGRDPFSIPDTTSSTLISRLECEVVVNTIKGGNERQDHHVSSAMSKQVADSYKAWVLTNPSLHTPSRLYMGGPLPLAKAVNMLNHVLVIMYDTTFKREGNTKKNGERTYTYVARESQDFPRVNLDFSCHKTKPSVKLWANAPLHDLSEAEIIQVGKRHLQLAPGYAARQGGDYSRHAMSPIRPEDLLPVSKKRRL
jgi:hypothetical protein